MKPFNLQEALAGKPVVTREGKSAVSLVKFPIDGQFRVYGVVSGSIGNWTESGRWTTNSESQNNLFMASEKKEGWVNVYRYDSKPAVGHLYASEADARRYIVSGHLATVRIEWEE